MPIDQYGNRADLIIDPTSIISRINIGSLYEHYFNGTSRDVRKLICESLGMKKGDASLDKLSKLDPSIVLVAYQTYLKYLSIVSQRQYDFYANLSETEKLEALTVIVNDDLYTYMPTDNTNDSVGMVTELEKTFGFKIGPVVYTGASGNKVTTKTDVRIAPMYYMLLDKIADSWSGVATGKLQHFGVLTPITKSEKFALPFKNTATKTCGETEGRLMVGYAGEEAVAEVMDRANNPQTQRNIVWNILNADKPTAIKEVVDRKNIPLGSSKNLQLVKHILHCSGISLKYEVEDSQQ